MKDINNKCYEQVRAGRHIVTIQACSLALIAQPNKKKKNFLGVLIFRPVPEVIWAANSENYIG
jgi:hypothetical protein